MKKQITLWIINASLATLIYAIGNNTISGNNDLFILGKLLVPILLKDSLQKTSHNLPQNLIHFKLKMLCNF